MCFKKVANNRAVNAGDAKSSKNGKGAATTKEPEFPVKPVTIQVVQTARGNMNHSYRDFSKVPPQEGYKAPKSIDDMTFSEKVHHILSQEEYNNWISWVPHGRAFKVHVPVLFESQVCPKYFGHKRYSSFLRELNNYGFKHISKGVDRNCYYHEFMLRDRPHLCQYMPKRKDARRLQVDPANEPNFYSINKQYPLSPDASAAKEDATKQQAADGSSTQVPINTSSNAMATSPYAAVNQAAMAPPQAAAAMAPPVSNIAFPTLPTSQGGADRASVLLALLEAKRKQEEEQRQRAAALVQLFQQQQAQQQQAAAQVQVQQQQQQQQQTDANVSALWGLLNQMN